MFVEQSYNYYHCHDDIVHPLVTLNLSHMFQIAVVTTESHQASSVSDHQHQAAG